MSDSFWFFPKQQNVQNTPIAPTAPVPPTPPVSSYTSSEKTLDDALSDIEHEMASVASTPTQQPLNTDTTPPAPVVAPTHEQQPVISAAPHHPRLELLKHALEEIKKNTQKALDLLHEEMGSPTPTIPASPMHQLSQLVPGMAIDMTRHTFHPTTDTTSSAGDTGNAIEGIFDGQGMIGPDGKQYSIPPNYASKSKLVEGDVLKLTINHNGSFIYKQIGPIARRRVVGILETDPETHMFVVKAEGHIWRVLTASVTYFKGVPGDEVVILIPRDKPTQWAAVENIIKTL